MSKVTVVSLPDKAVGLPEMAEQVSTAPAIKQRMTESFKVGRLLVRRFAAVVTAEYLFVAVLAFLLSRVSILGEISPFGLAFFAATAQFLPSQALGAGFWVIVGSLSAGHYSEASVYGLSVLLYFLLADKLTLLHRKFLAVPLFLMGTVLIGGLGLAYMNLPVVTLYTVLEICMEAAMCMLLAYAFLYAFPVLQAAPASAGRQLSQETFMCLVVLLAIASNGLDGWWLLDYNVRNMAGSLLIMILALAGGPGAGAAAGTVLGLAAGLLDGAVMHVAYYALAGTFAGIFRKFGKFAVILGFETGSLLTILFFGQAAELLNVLSESALAAIPFICLPMSWLGEWTARFVPRGERAKPSQKISEAATKLTHVADLFQELAMTMNRVSEPRPEQFREEATAKVLAAIDEQVCGACAQRANCWEVDFYRTSQVISELILSGEAITSSTLPPYLRSVCIKQRELAVALAAVAEQSGGTGGSRYKLAGQRQLVAEQMKAIANIVGNLAQEVVRETKDDRRAAALLASKAAEAGCPVSGVKVNGRQGTLCIRLEKEPCQDRQECRQVILPLAANLLQERMVLRTQCGHALRHKPCQIVLQPAKRFTVQAGMASLAKEVHQVCGDTCSVTHLPQGKTLLLLSDGMGSGSQAATESSLAVQLMEKLLTAGFSVEAAIRTTNAMLLLQGPAESFATLDMAIIDTYNGAVEFLKIGAPPSFVKRVHEVGMIRSASLPIGILQQIEIEPVEAQLAAGDIIVMVSDGVADVQATAAGKENWVINYLRRLRSSQPQEVAQQILAEAKRLSGGRLRDDMTVLAVRIAESNALQGKTAG